MKSLKLAVILIFILLSAFTVLSAEEFLDKAGEWLADNLDLNKDIETVAFSAIALDLTDQDTEATSAYDKIQDRKDVDDCWPKGKCEVKDTAFGLLAMAHAKRTTSSTVDWFEDAELPTTSKGKWWLQIAASDDGMCKVIFENEDGEQERKDFTLSDQKVVECANRPWVDINSCLERGIVDDALGKELEVDCTNLDSNVIISLIFQINNEYYILQEEHSNLATIKLNNACFGTTEDSSRCDYESTLFASYVLDKLGRNINTIPYLRSNLKNEDVVGQSLLFLITRKNVYTELLKDNQNPNGNFGNVYTTAFVNLALRGQDLNQSPADWLEFQQRLDGSWSNSQRDTAVVIYSFLEKDDIRGDTTRTCRGAGYVCCDACSDEDESFGEFDDSCSQGQVCCNECAGEVENTCDKIGGERCLSGDACLGGVMQETLDTNFCCLGGTCVSDIECTADNDCGLDEECIQGKCVVKEVTEDLCDDDLDNDNDALIDCDDPDCIFAEDCQKSGFPWIIIIIIIIVLVLGIGGYLYYKKYGIPKELERFFKRKGKPKKEFRPQQIFQARQPETVGRATKVDKELEKSLEEARKLLGKKKPKK